MEIIMGIVRRYHLADIDLFPDGPIRPCVGAFSQYLNQRQYAAKLQTRLLPIFAASRISPDVGISGTVGGKGSTKC